MISLLSILLVAAGLIGALALVCGQLRWKSATRRLAEGLAAARLPIPENKYSASELGDLPAPVQRFLRAALTDGQRIVAGVALGQTGTFNQSETAAAWKPFTAVQRVVTRRPGYFWDARIMMFPGVPVRVRDAYVAGEGILQAAILGIFPVANLRDSGELAKGELLRFLAEAAWYPTALLPSQGIRWAEVDDRSARATLRDGALSVDLLFRFNADGLIDTLRADARGRMEGATVVHLPWEGRFWNYAVRDGMRVPLEGEVAWIHPEGTRLYWRGRITTMDYEFHP